MPQNVAADDQYAALMKIAEGYKTPAPKEDPHATVDRLMKEQGIKPDPQAAVLKEADRITSGFNQAAAREPPQQTIDRELKQRGLYDAKAEAQWKKLENVAQEYSKPSPADQKIPDDWRKQLEKEARQQKAADEKQGATPQPYPAQNVLDGDRRARGEKVSPSQPPAQKSTAQPPSAPAKPVPPPAAPPDRDIGKTVQLSPAQLGKALKSEDGYIMTIAMTGAKQDVPQINVYKQIDGGFQKMVSQVASPTANGYEASVVMADGHRFVIDDRNGVDGARIHAKIIGPDTAIQDVNDFSVKELQQAPNPAAVNPPSGADHTTRPTASMSAAGMDGNTPIRSGVQVQQQFTMAASGVAPQAGPSYNPAVSAVSQQRSYKTGPGGMN
jgi:hypothetical protein